MTGETPSAVTKRLLFVLSGSTDAVGYGLVWAERLAGSGVDVTVALLSDPPPAAASPAVRMVDLRGRGFLSAVRGVRSGIRVLGADTVIAVTAHANLCSLVAAALARDVSAHVLIVELDLSSPVVRTSGARGRVADVAARALYRRASAAASSSHVVAAEISARFGVPPSRSLVVPPPVLPDDGPPPVRAPASEGDAGVSILLTGAADPAARTHLVLETAYALAAEGETVEVLTLTDPAPPSLRDLAARLDIPLRHEPAGLAGELPTRSVLLLPSAHEGFAGLLVDAAARGIPSVAVSSALGVAETIVTGVTGELALDDDPESLAAAVLAARAASPDEVADWLGRYRATASATLLGEAIAFAGRVG